MLLDREKLEINPVENRRSEIIEIGENRYPVLIVDNYYKDPDYVRELALSLGYMPPNSPYPGVMASIDLGKSSLCEAIWRQLIPLYGGTVNTSMQPTTSSHDFFVLDRPESRLNAWECTPRVEMSFLGGSIFLNPDDQCKGGTGFYRHKETGLEEMLLTNIFGQAPEGSPILESSILQKVEEMGLMKKFNALHEKGDFKEYPEMIHKIMSEVPKKTKYMTEGNEDWELIELIKMKYNRLICYPAFLFNTDYFQQEWFGDSLDTQYLSQKFYFHWPTTPPEPR
jgi:hypothetical protein